MLASLTRLFPFIYQEIQLHIYISNNFLQLSWHKHMISTLNKVTILFAVSVMTIDWWPGTGTRTLIVITIIHWIDMLHKSHCAPASHPRLNIRLLNMELLSVWINYKVKKKKLKHVYMYYHVKISKYLLCYDTFATMQRRRHCFRCHARVFQESWLLEMSCGVLLMTTRVHLDGISVNGRNLFGDTSACY